MTEAVRIGTSISGFDRQVVITLVLLADDDAVRGWTQLVLLTIPIALGIMKPCEVALQGSPHNL